MFVSRLRTRVLYVEFYAVLNQGIGLYYQNVYQKQRDLRISIYIEPQSSPPVRNATHLRTFCFLEVIFAFGEIFVNLRVFLQLDYIEDNPKLP